MAESESRAFEDKVDSEGWLIKELWEKYEEIAMHFNDLLIRLRTQALGGVAALSTLVGLFAKTSATVSTSWEIASVFFAFVCFLWLAVWIIDFAYYNRLLLGAVSALEALEERSKTESRVRHIELSTMIERAVAHQLSDKPRSKWLMFGRWAFYMIVFLVLFFGLLVSVHEYRNTPSQMSSQTCYPPG